MGFSIGAESAAVDLQHSVIMKARNGCSFAFILTVQTHNNLCALRCLCGSNYVIIAATLAGLAYGGEKYPGSEVDLAANKQLTHLMKALPPRWDAMLMARITIGEKRMA